MTPQRIKEAAKAKYPFEMSHTITDGPREGYIAGATAEFDRAQGLVDALESIIKSGENIRSVYQTSKPPFYIKIAKEALAKWKGEVEHG